jgi:hypothetical protein
MKSFNRTWNTPPGILTRLSRGDELEALAGVRELKPCGGNCDAQGRFVGPDGAVAVISGEPWIYQCLPVLWGASSVLLCILFGKRFPVAASCGRFGFNTCSNGKLSSGIGCHAL